MRIVGAEDLDRLLDVPALIDAIGDAFASEIVVPVRHHHEMGKGDTPATHLLMPAWTVGRSPNFLGTKVVNVFPTNAARGLPSVMGSYLLMSGDTGEPLAVMDGARLTLWRTAAASALASRFLSRPDAERLVMVGAGALAPFLIRAHAAVRLIREVLIWNPRPAKAEMLAASLHLTGVSLRSTTDLEAAVRAADVVTCATLSVEPVVRGAWLAEGAHLDLVGAYRPAMRESDDEAVRRARLFVDTRAGAMKEGGDIVQPLTSGVIGPDRIEADLFDLCRGKAVAREANDITLFKSTGTAIEDIAAAMLAWTRLQAA